MKLEDELSQTKPFKSEFQKLILNIAVTSSWLNSVFSERLKPFDITPHQYNVLRILKGKHPESYCNQEITRRMIDKSSNSTRIVDKLVEKMLAVRAENTCDRRQVDIKITDTGLYLLNEIDEAPFPESMTLMAFNEEKAKLMNEWLDEIRG
jgi:DNA-binding MarR family transcriptional regulator